MAGGPLSSPQKPCDAGYFSTAPMKNTDLNSIGLMSSPGGSPGPRETGLSPGPPGFIFYGIQLRDPGAALWVRTQVQVFSGLDTTE